MLPQYKLVIISAIASLIIGSIVGIYWYKKKGKVHYVFLLILISLLPLVSLLRPGSYESGDLSLNVFKTMALDYSLKDGVFPANWAGILNATYGYPMFNFAYPLPYYASWGIHQLGFSFIDSIKLFIASTFIVSGIGMYFFLKTLLKPFYAFVGGVFYLFAPYHLVDMHFRVDIGEISAMVFIPLVFLWSTTLLQKYNPYHSVLLALSVCGLLLSHQAISLATIPLLAVYIVVFAYLQPYPFRSMLRLVLSGMMGVGLSAFYLLPVLFELQFTQQSHGQTVTFPAWWEFIYSPWRYGLLFQGNMGQLSFVLGYTHLFCIGLAVYLLWKKTVKSPYKPLLIFSLFTSFFLFFMMQSFSEPLWYSIPLIKNFQFSYRLLAVLMFFLASIAAISALYLPKKAVYVLIFIAIFSTILNWGNRRNIPELTDEYFASRLPYSTYEGEGLTPAAPKWADQKNPWFKTPPKKHLEVVQGKADIKQLSRSTNKHHYTISAEKAVMLLEHTAYFPGWQILVNGKPTDIHITNEPGKKGLMHFVAPKGTSDILVVYASTPIRQTGMVLTLLSGVACISLASIGYKKYS